MKAVIYRRYGSADVLELAEVATPSPRDDEVLIKVHATTVTSGDRRLRSLDVPAGFKLISRLLFGLGAPRQRILGSELAGVVEAVGKDVWRFKPGDEVFAYDGAGLGCHAEYRVLRQDAAIALKPADLGFREAAALSFGGVTALAFIDKAKLQPGDTVLVHGASGAVGSAAVQLAAHFGAHVTGVCSRANVELVIALGAEAVIDYARGDFTQHRATYDLIIDTTGLLSFARCRDALKPRGRLALVAASLPQMLAIPWAALTGRKKVLAGPVTGRAEDLEFLARLAETGAYRPLIDRHFRFAQIADAHRHVDTGHKRGNVVVSVVGPAAGVHPM